MKKIISLTIICLLTGFLFAEMKYAGILQSRANYNMENESKSDYLLPRARLILKGDVKDNIGFFIQSNMGNIIDVKLNYSWKRLNTVFTIGRFLPNYTYYMPVHTGKLDLIDYPLLTSKTATWRQVGYQFDSQLTKSVGFNLGLFNGALEPDNWSDTTRDGKDLLLNLHYKSESFDLTGYWWMINAIASDVGDAEGSRTGMAAHFNRSGLKLLGEFLISDWGDGTNGISYYVQGGYKFYKGRMELLARYDTWDPDKDLSGDDLTHTTLGLNYYLSGQNAMFYFDIIFIDDTQSVNHTEFEVQYQILF